MYIYVNHDNMHVQNYYCCTLHAMLQTIILNTLLCVCVVLNGERKKENTILQMVLNAKESKEFSFSDLKKLLKTLYFKYIESHS